MGFLGRALTQGASKFIGRAVKASQFVGRAVPTISKGLQSAQRFAHNSAVQQAGQAIGIGPSVFNKVGAAIGHVNSAVNLAPSVVGDARAALTQAHHTLQPAKRSIAELYQQANGVN